MVETVTYYIAELWQLLGGGERVHTTIRMSPDTVKDHLRVLTKANREIIKVSKVTIQTEDETHLYSKAHQYKVVYDFEIKGVRQKGEQIGSPRPYSRTHAEALASGLNEIYGEGSHQAVPVDYTSE